MRRLAPAFIVVLLVLAAPLRAQGTTPVTTPASFPDSLRPRGALLAPVVIVAAPDEPQRNLIQRIAKVEEDRQHVLGLMRGNAQLRQVLHVQDRQIVALEGRLTYLKEDSARR